MDTLKKNNKECTLIIICKSNTEISAQKHFLTKPTRFLIFFFPCDTKCQYLQAEYNFSLQQTLETPCQRSKLFDNQIQDVQRIQSKFIVVYIFCKSNDSWHNRARNFSKDHCYEQMTYVCVINHVPLQIIFKIIQLSDWR